MANRLDIDELQLQRFCHRWGIKALELFGSVLRDDYGPDSDVDVLVTFDRDVRWSLLDHQAMEDQLSRMLGRPVDLISRRAVERGSNWLRRKEILETAESWYAAG
jgi:uncharacterized protein